MKKRLLALSMAAIMTVGSLTACGGNNGGSTGTTDSGSSTTTTDAGSTDAGSTDAGSTDAGSTDAGSTDAGSDAGSDAGTDVAAADEGKVLNIYVWNEEFKNRLTDHYPGYTKVDETSGKIGDVDVKWTTVPSDDNAYQNNLDETLLKQADAAADDKIDIFLLEADYALKYVDTPYTMPLTDLGISEADLSDQYKYTQDIVRDSNGVLKGSSWQACSAGLIYNREAAMDILGADDPDTVQDAVSSWDKYAETAAAAKAKGYVMCSVNDTYRVYSNNVSSKWVVDGKINIDANIDKWVDDSMKLVAEGEETTNDLWGDDWAKAKDPAGKTFCYFGPAWFFNFCLDADREGSIANNGGWGYVVGPQSFFWGGTWIAAATGTDNPTLVKDIILTMTTDKAVLKEIAQVDADCVNSKTVLAELASDDSGNIALLGGQNPYAMLKDGAEKVDLSNLSPYDQGCTEEFQKNMKNYFLGQCSKEEAIDAFYKAVVEKYPELTY